MRGAVLAAVVLAAILAGPAVASTAPRSGEPASRAAGAVAPRELPARSPPVAADGDGAPVAEGDRPGAGPLSGEPPVAVQVTRRDGDGEGVAGPAGPFGGPVAAVDGGAADVEEPPNGTAAVTVAHELSLTPRRPGELRVEIRVRRRNELDNGTANLSLGLSRRATVVSATGFERAGDRYRLNRSYDVATLTYWLQVNRTAPGGGYEAVDAGSWALVRTPTPSVTTRDLAVERRYSVDGEGVVRDGLAYIGPHRRYDRTVQQQRISLVVPAAAELRSRPAAVLDSLSAAARTLEVGDRDPSVLFVAAPTSVDWAYAAQQVGDADAWVQADQSLYDPRNAWLHEYVHTRQAFRATREARWLVEGTATYYAALLSLRQGLVDFGAFRRHLLAGTAPHNSNAVLAKPPTWRDSRAEYLKGGLVVAAIDRRIRLASDGRRSFEWVFGRLNAHRGPVGLATLASLAGAVGDRRLRASTWRYATEPTGPTTWGRDAHRRAFGWSPPRVSTQLVGLTATGPGGVRAFGASPEEVVLLTDQRLVARVRAENRGDRPAAAVAPFRVNFTAVNRTVVGVDPHGWTLTSVAHRFTEPGTYYVTVGGEALRVRVVEPAGSVRVTDVTVANDPYDRERTVTVVTRVRNLKDRPARLSLPVVVDGEVVASRTVAVGPNRVRLVETTVTLDRPGRHQVAIAGEAAAVNVSASGDLRTPTATSARATGTGGLSPTPAGRRAAGMLGLVAAAVAMALVSRRW